MAKRALLATQGTGCLSRKRCIGLRSMSANVHRLPIILMKTWRW